MIPEKIKKLIEIRTVGSSSQPCLDDVRVGMELLKKEFPVLPTEVKEYLYMNVRYEIVEEYINGSGPDYYKWKENDT